ncbi:MAG: AAA family ATPase [Nitrosopumilaceae archaeon]|jgi:DNA polymerase III subunit gamma/tau
MALDKKYRPGNWDDFYGNIPTVKSLKAVISKDDPPHSYFFSGPPGCGKTTLARILTNELECHVNDLREINMGNNRGIDTAREIINNVYFQPMYGKTKVYLLDEVHKSTSEFQNAMLKIVEEPPEHVYFVFCTTEPERVINTIKSRCACYSVSLLPEKRIKKLLFSICEKENIELKEEYFDEIAKASAGSPRQALIILDQVKGVEEKYITKSIQKYSDRDAVDVKKLCRALLERRNWKVISKIIKGIEAEPETVRRAVLGYMAAVALNNSNSQAFIVIDNFQDNFFDSGKAGLVLACYSSLL